MRRDLNNIFIIGRLTKDPEMAYTPTGTALTKFSIANGQKIGDKDYTNFFDVTAWGKQAEIISQYCKKGKQIAITGELRQDRWVDKQSGQNRSKIHIIANNVQFLGNSDSKPSGQAAGITPEFQQKASELFNDPWAEAKNNDDDIPW